MEFITNVDQIIEICQSRILGSGYLINRDHKRTKEVIGAQFEFDIFECKFDNDVNTEEYHEYLKIISPQLDYIKPEFNDDIFSRRLLLQFDRNYYNKMGLRAVPCPESMLILVLNHSYVVDLIVNLRSTNISKLKNDLNMLIGMLNYTGQILNVTFRPNRLYLQIASLHEYI
jgi:hypothetical protein